LGSDWQGKMSIVGYLIAVPLAFAASWMADALYLIVALFWLVPDRRIERVIAAEETH
jgi:hypothetical protein